MVRDCRLGIPTLDNFAVACSRAMTTAQIAFLSSWLQRPLMLSSSWHPCQALGLLFFVVNTGILHRFVHFGQTWCEHAGEEIKSPKTKVIRVEPEETQHYGREAKDLSQEEAEEISFVPGAISVP